MKMILNRTLAQHRLSLDKGEYTSMELTQACFLRIQEKNKELGAFLEVDVSAALKAAAQSDARIRQGKPLSPLDGIPFAAKDNLCTKGLRTTCASRMLEDFVPPYDATVIARLKACGAVLIGKTNMDEFAMGSAGEYSAFYPVRNPVNPAYAAGGSSGGSAAAVASGMVPFALGSDTGGSVRQPAAFCGVVGFRPTYGALSRYGLIAMASSMDCVGLVTANATDCQTVFSVLLGKDSKDATSLEASLFEHSFVPLQGLRAAVVSFGDITPRQKVLDCMNRAADLLVQQGAKIKHVQLPSAKDAEWAYRILSSAEIASNLARYDGIRYGLCKSGQSNLQELYVANRTDGFGKEAQRRILLGSRILSEDKRACYRRALELREQVSAQMKELFLDVDLLISPVSVSTAFLHGEERSPMDCYAEDAFSVHASLSGCPALSLPFGKAETGLPLAIQLICRPTEECLLFEVAKALEGEKL